MIVVTPIYSYIYKIPIQGVQLLSELHTPMRSPTPPGNREVPLASEYTSVCDTYL